MARLIQAKSSKEVAKLTVTTLRNEYNALADGYNELIDGKKLFCPKCGEWLKAETGFYSNKNFITGRYPECKRCIMQEVEQRANDTDEPNETKESVQRVLQKMDLVYDDDFYEQCVKGALDDAKERNRNSPFAIYISSILSLPNWKNKAWKDSKFNKIEISEKETREPRPEIKKMFGSGFTTEDYLYLQDQYDDWCQRTAVDSKAQQLYVVRICFKQLDIWKAQLAGADTTKLDTSLNDLMNAANLQPRQNVSNAATDSLTFGQLIERWEQDRPIPEPTEEFKDVDGIGKYIRVWFTGWLCKALGLNANVFTKEYDEEIKKYTVEKPDYTDEGGADAIYDRLFGTEGD